MAKKAKSRAAIARDTVRRHGSKTSWRQRIPGGARRAPSEFSKASLTRGVEVELEHTNDPLLAMEIAMDHLDEQTDYYEMLREVEGNPQVSATSRTAAAAARLARGEN